jgi:hypothetical protein
VTGRCITGRVVGALIWTLVAAALWSMAAGSAMGASSGAIRACVERNLVRYADPGNALDAQYADLEAACISALDGDGTTAGFTPDPGTGTTTENSGTSAPATPGGSSDSGGGGGTTSSAPATASTGATPATAPHRTRGEAASQPARQPSRESSKAIVLAAAANDGGAGSPVSDELGSPWFIGILVAAALIGGAALVIGARRRTR